LEFTKTFVSVPSTAEDGKPCWGVRTVFRAKNKLGARVLNNGYFHIRNEQVLEITELTPEN